MVSGCTSHKGENTVFLFGQSNLEWLKLSLDYAICRSGVRVQRPLCDFISSCTVLLPSSQFVLLTLQGKLCHQNCACSVENS